MFLRGFPYLYFPSAISCCIGESADIFVVQKQSEKRVRLSEEFFSKALVDEMMQKCHQCGEHGHFTSRDTVP